MKLSPTSHTYFQAPPPKAAHYLPKGRLFCRPHVYLFLFYRKWNRKTSTRQLLVPFWYLWYNIHKAMLAHVCARWALARQSRAPCVYWIIIRQARGACLRRCRTFYRRKMRMWYNKHNTKDEKRKRFSNMCLLNRCEASRFAACIYGIIMKRIKERGTCSA